MLEGCWMLSSESREAGGRRMLDELRSFSEGAFSITELLKRAEGVVILREVKPQQASQEGRC